MRDRFERVHNSYASSFSRITNALSIDLSQQTQHITRTHKDSGRIIKTTFSNLIFCLSVIRCFLTATEKCILLIFISFVLLCVCVEVRAHIPSGAHPIRARSCFTEIRTEETLEPGVIICL